MKSGDHLLDLTAPGIGPANLNPWRDHLFEFPLDRLHGQRFVHHQINSVDEPDLLQDFLGGGDVNEAKISFQGFRRPLHL